MAGLVLSNATVEQNRWLPQVTQRIGERIANATHAREPERDESKSRSRAEDAPTAARRSEARVVTAEPAGPSGAEPREPSGSSSDEALEHPSGALGALSAANPAENSAERRAGRHRIRVTPGRVAYLRCDGAPEQAGLFPCPRDRALEERAFAAILGLATCRELAATNPAPIGRADAWLIFHGPELGGIRMRESPGAEATSEIVRTCLEARLAGVRSRVESERMTVSFRFDLR